MDSTNEGKKTMEERLNNLKKELLKTVCTSNDIAEDSGLVGDIDYALTMIRNESLSELQSLVSDILGKSFGHLKKTEDKYKLVSVEDVLQAAREHGLKL